MVRYPSQGGRYKGRKGPSNYTRKNERIRAPKVRVIGPDGKQLGLMHPKKALEIAKEHQLDLVEISPNADPPVCRIMDFGKFKYEQSKKSKDSKSQSSKIKEIKFRLTIDSHDYMTKLKRAEEFLGKGNKVKLTLTLRGREMQQGEMAFDLMKRAISDLTHMSSPDFEPKKVGRHVNGMLSPLPENKRRPKYTIEEEE